MVKSTVLRHFVGLLSRWISEEEYDSKDGAVPMPSVAPSVHCGRKADEGVCSPSLAQEFGVQRYKFLELDVLDAQIVDQVCKDTLRGMSVLLDVNLISEQTASDSIVFHPADIAVMACAVCGYICVP